MQLPGGQTSTLPGLVGMESEQLATGVAFPRVQACFKLSRII